MNKVILNKIQTLYDSCYEYKIRGIIEKEIPANTVFSYNDYDDVKFGVVLSLDDDDFFKWLTVNEERNVLEEHHLCLKDDSLFDLFNEEANINVLKKFKTWKEAMSYFMDTLYHDGKGVLSEV